MSFEELRKKLIDYPIFSFVDIFKWFPDENPNTLKLQLSQWQKKGYLRKLKKGLYFLSETKIEDPFFIANRIYSPSYISLETALNCYGIIPDVPQMITCVTPLTTAKFKTPFGVFYFHHLKSDYFFGFKIIGSKDKKYSYSIALPEKALLDFIYFNLPRFSKLKSFEEERFEFEKDFNWPLFLKMAKTFRNKKILEVAKKIKKSYG